MCTPLRGRPRTVHASIYNASLCGKRSAGSPCRLGWAMHPRLHSAHLPYCSLARLSGSPIFFSASSSMIHCGRTSQVIFNRLSLRYHVTRARCNYKRNHCNTVVRDHIGVYRKQTDIRGSSKIFEILRFSSLRDCNLDSRDI